MAILPIEKINISDDVANRLSEAIQIKTISYEDSIKPQGAAFESLHNFLSEKSEYFVLGFLGSIITISKFFPLLSRN